MTAKEHKHIAKITEHIMKRKTQLHKRTMIDMNAKLVPWKKEEEKFTGMWGLRDALYKTIKTRRYYNYEGGPIST